MSHDGTTDPVPHIRIERAGNVARLVVSNPRRKNAINGEMWGQLTAACTELAEDATIRAVVLTGEGEDFCSGADVSRVANEESSVSPLENMRYIGRSVLAMHELPKPVVARVDGVAAGAGMNLALAADIVVASDRARFSQIFAKRGLTVDWGGSWLLPRLVGMHRAKELVLLADMWSAPELAQLGLLNRVVPVEQLDATVDDVAVRLAAGPPIALSMSKKLLNAGPESTLSQAVEAEAQAQSVNFATRDTLEAMMAFAEKRPPVFEGR
ncbi:MAG: enoyl-CoA hydratase-related protein [Acidimicrobiales bacterium]|jgi:2-(1,2-epoxy-1,2-dihydrophenyl)acetyl-CoA isomerase|nr:enoyl-CoA hydratase-related protein [Acidimicrobiales bacterium]